MRKTIFCSTVATAVLGMAALSHGAGFRIAEQGTKATSMGNAFAAQADDPSALAYNPAGIAFLKGTQLMVGATTILVPQTEFQGTTQLSPATEVQEKANRDIFLIPTLYATTSLASAPVSFGIGVNSFFPLAKRWDAGSAFRNSIQEIAIKPINFQPTVAYRCDKLNLAVAAGLDVSYAMVSLQKMPSHPALGQLGVLGLDGTAVGTGYNMGAKWQATPRISFGAAYRSEIKLDIDGQANFASSPAGVTAGLPAGTTRTGVKTTVTLPDVLSLGVAVKPTDALTLEFDAERTGWSSYKKLEFTFDGALAPAFNNKPDAKDWEDVWAYRFGAQYAASKTLDLRAGYAYDTTPAPGSTVGPELPDADRHNFSAGLGVHNEFGSFDLGYMWVKFLNRNVSNAKQSGEYKSDAQIFSASVTYKF